MSWVKACAVLSVILLVAACPDVEDRSHHAHYVSTTGNDANAGTKSKPWRTIQHAADMAQAGDSVVVRAGVYPEKVIFPNSGTRGKRITFMSEPRKTAVIDGTGINVGSYGSLIEIRDVHYLTLSGFEIRNSSWRNIHVGGNSSHIQLQNLNVHHAAGEAQIFLDGPNSAPAFSSISGCMVHDAPGGGIAVWQCGGGYWAIENNEVYNNVGTNNWDGIQVEGAGTGTHHIIVKNNTIHDNATWTQEGADNLDLTGNATNHHYLVEGNDVYGDAGSFKLHSGRNYVPGVSSFHIARFNQFTRIPYVCYDFPNPIAIYNNTFVDGGQFVMFYGQDPSQVQSLGDSTYSGGDTGRMNWKNNLFFQEIDSSAYALLCSGASSAVINLGYESVRFQNSLYKLAPKQKFAWDSIFGPPVDANAFAEYQASYAPDYPDTGSLLTAVTPDEMFVDYPSRGYHLFTGSPAIDTGTALTVATNAGNQSTLLTVDRASYFFDGYPVNGEYLSTPDLIMVGSNAPVAIVSIDDATNTITLKAPLSWNEGDSVTLPYKGTAPDIGAVESK